MSKIRTFLDNFYKKIGPAFALIAVVGGFVAGFLLWATAPNEGYFGIDHEQLSIAPIVIPLLLLASVAAIYCVLDILLSLFECLEDIKNCGTQLVLILIVIIASVGMYFVIEASWQVEYWQDATKYGNNGGIGDIIYDMLEFVKQYSGIALTSLALEIVIGLALLVLLNIAKNKYIGNYKSIHDKLQILSGVVAVTMLLVNCAIYNTVTTLIFAYTLMLALVLLPATIALHAKTCPCCLHYNCGRTLISSETRSYTDYADTRVVSSTDYHYDEDDTTITVQTVAPTVKTETTYTYRCNHCGMTFNK